MTRGPDKENIFHSTKNCNSKHFAEILSIRSTLLLANLQNFEMCMIRYWWRNTVFSAADTAELHWARPQHILFVGGAKISLCLKAAHMCLLEVRNTKEDKEKVKETLIPVMMQTLAVSVLCRCSFVKDKPSSHLCGVALQPVNHIFMQKSWMYSLIVHPGQLVCISLTKQETCPDTQMWF